MQPYAMEGCRYPAIVGEVPPFFRHPEKEESHMADNHRYEMSLDGGQGGSDHCYAATIEEALVMALEWAAEGEWGFSQEGTEEQYGGCGEPVAVRVWREDEDGEVLEQEHAEYTIPTLGDLRDETIDEEGETLAERSGEYSTERIVRIDGEYYYQHPNGGDRGAWNRQDGDGVWRDRPVEPTREITVSEARTILLDWGYDPQEVAGMMERTK